MTYAVCEKTSGWVFGRFSELAQAREEHRRLSEMYGSCIVIIEVAEAATL